MKNIYLLIHTLDEGGPNIYPFSTFEKAEDAKTALEDEGFYDSDLEIVPMPVDADMVCTDLGEDEVHCVSCGSPTNDWEESAGQTYCTVCFGALQD